MSTPAWLDGLLAALARGEDCVLVTVARAEGSTPREAGAAMVVTRDQAADTIGGGHLEWDALHQARRQLAAGPGQPRLQRYNLGARLGQCCGGVAWLLFETIPAADLAPWQQRAAHLAAGGRLRRTAADRLTASRWPPAPQPGLAPLLAGSPEHWTFTQALVAPAFPVLLFGAGHVAQALARQLRPLGAALTWVDSREEAFADVDTGGLTPVVTEVPEAEVAAAPAGSFFLVMTHSHALDFALCEAIFRRRDFAYFGLIGSRSKRASFSHRLLDRGLSPDRLGEMTCPIGIPGIVSKEPAAIALAVAAQVYQIHNARQLVDRAGNRPLSVPTPLSPLSEEP